MIEPKYKIKKSTKAKNLRISIYPNQNVVVTIPNGLGLSDAERFVNEKINWIKSKLKSFSKIKTPILTLSGSKSEYKKLKQTARDLVLKKIEFFNKFYNFTYNKISIRNQKTRWGSCSKNGKLNFNYRIAKLPSELADYIIVHELCHLKELNHSKRFWDLVTIAIPNYKELRKQIRNIS